MTVSPRDEYFLQSISRAAYLTGRPSYPHRNSSTSLAVKGIPKQMSKDFLQQQLEEGRPSLLSPTNTDLGPGCYNLKLSTLSGAACTFASQSRFPRHERGFFLAPHSLSREPKSRVSSVTDLNFFVPAVRKEQLTQRSRALDEKIKQVKQRKKQLFEATRRCRLARLEVKESRYERQLKRQEELEIQSRWTRVLAFFGMAWVMHAAARRKTLLKQKAKLLSNLFFAVARIVGKARRRAIELRHSKAIQVMKRLKAPTRRWIAARRLQYHTAVVDLLERVASQDIMVTLMCKWRSALLTIQRNLRHLLARRKLVLWVKVRVWQRHEAAHGRPPVKLSKRVLAHTLPATVPEHVKAHFVRGALNRRIREYLDEVRSHETYCKKLSYKNSRFRLNTMQSVVSIPDRPCMDLHLAEGDYKKLRMEAIRTHTQWPGM